MPDAAEPTEPSARPDPAARGAPDRPERPERFLIVCLGGITRVVNALPALHALRATYPDSEIGWAVDSRFAPLLGQKERGHPELTRIHPVPREEWRALSWWRRRGAVREFESHLRSFGYTSAVDLHGRRESARITCASGARVRVSYALPEGERMRRRRYTYRIIPSPARKHLAERNLSLLVPLAVKPREPHCVLPDLADARARVRRSVRGLDARYAVLHAGSSWESKRLPAESCAALAREIVSGLSLRVILTADGKGNGEGKGKDKIEDKGEAEHTRAEEIAGKAGDGVTLAPELRVDELAALIGGAALFVGGDAGPMHIAWASGVPTVAVFGPTRPARTGPLGERTRAVTAELECLGCGQRTCPEKTSECMRQLASGRIVELAREVVA